MNINDISTDSSTLISTKALWTLCSEVEIYSSMVRKLIELRKKEAELMEQQRTILEHRKLTDKVFEKAENDMGTLMLIYDTILNVHDEWLENDEFTHRMIASINRMSKEEEEDVRKT